MLINQFHGSPRGFLGCQRVENNPAGITLDEGDVGQIESAHLVNTFHHLVQPEIHVELALPMQGGVNAVEPLILKEELVAVHVPGYVASIAHDFPRLGSRNKTLLLLVKIPGIGERQGGARRFQYL